MFKNDSIGDVNIISDLQSNYNTMITKYEVS